MGWRRHDCRTFGALQAGPAEPEKTRGAVQGEAASLPLGAARSGRPGVGRCLPLPAIDAERLHVLAFQAQPLTCVLDAPHQRLVDRVNRSAKLTMPPNQQPRY